MTRILHLHIGHPKTATSFLQNKLHLNEDWLSSRGVHIPSNFQSLSFHNFRDVSIRGLVHAGNASYLYLAHCRPAALNQLDIPAYWKAVFEPADGKDIILSSELLFYAPPRVFASIRTHCAAQGYETHLVTYLERQDRAVVKGYMQAIRNHGHFGSVADYLDFGRRRKYFRYKTVLDGIVASLRPREVHVRTFDPSFLCDKDIWSDLSSLGLSQLRDAPTNPANAVNQGLNIVAIELIRAGNRLAAEGAMPKERWNKLLRQLLSLPAVTTNRAATHAYLYREDIFARLRADFADENTRLVQDYFAGDSRLANYWRTFEPPQKAETLPIGTQALYDLMHLLLVSPP